MVRIERLTPAEEAAVLKNLPDWAQQQKVTEIIRFTFEVPWRADMEEFILEHSPESFQVNFTHSVLSNTNPEILMATGLFPSGALRTVGCVSQVVDCSVWIEPFDYWSLIDPDSDRDGIEHSKTVSGELFIFVTITK